MPQLCLLSAVPNTLCDTKLCGSEKLFKAKFCAANRFRNTILMPMPSAGLATAARDGACAFGSIRLTRSLTGFLLGSGFSRGSDKGCKFSKVDAV